MAETLFDRFVFVDWSARSVPNTGRDSVWIADGNAAAVHTYNPSTREAAVERLRGLLTAAVAQNERVLVGFDFPYGYPAGSPMPWASFLATHRGGALGRSFAG